MKTGKKYSHIRKKLQIVVDKKTTNEMAHLSHYLQNYNNGASRNYKANAQIYLEKLHKDLNIIENPDFQYYLPIK